MITQRDRAECDFLTTCCVPAQNEYSESYKVRGEVKKIFFFETVKDYRYRSSVICLAMQAIGQVGHSLSMC